MITEESIELITLEIIVPCLLLMFFLALLLVTICFVVKKADENDKRLVLEKKRKEKEFENRLASLELKLEHVEVKPIGTNKFIS